MEELKYPIGEAYKSEGRTEEKEEALTETIFQQMVKNRSNLPQGTEEERLESSNHPERNIKEMLGTPSEREGYLHKPQFSFTGEEEVGKSPESVFYNPQDIEQPYKTTDITKSPLDWKLALKKLFTMYADFSDDTGNSIIKLNRYYKLMKDSNLIDNQKITKSKIDVIFFGLAAKNKGLSQQLFQNSLIKIAAIKYPILYEQNPKNATEKIVSVYLIPLFKLLKEKNEIAGNIIYTETYANIIYDDKVKIMLNALYPTLKSIYHMYFFAPFKKARIYSQLPQITAKQLIIFLRDFDFCPSPVSKQLSLQMLETLMGIQEDYLTVNGLPVFFEIKDQNGNEINQDYGAYFTLKRFFIMILWVSKTGFELSREDGGQYTTAEKVFYALTKMELSKGFNNLQRSTMKPYNQATTLLPPPAILQEIIQNNPVEKCVKLDSIYEDERIHKERDIEKEMLALELYMDKMQRMFMWYCSVGDNLNSNKMNATKFLKLLKDSELINQYTVLPRGLSPAKRMSNYKLSPAEVELIFKKVLSTVNDKNHIGVEGDMASPMRIPKLRGAFDKEGKHGRLEFESFIYALSLIANRIYPDLPTDQALISLVEKHIIRVFERNREMEEGSTMIQEMLLILENEVMVELLTRVHKIIQIYYYPYANKEGQMSHEHFIKFTKDFGIFPDLVSKTQLHRTFYALAFINTRMMEQSSMRSVGSSVGPMGTTGSQQNKECIDEHLFMEALALCALQSRAFERDTTHQQKVLHLIEKMMQSSGIAKVRKMSGTTRIGKSDVDPLLLLKSYYPKYFHIKTNKPQMVDFDGMFDEEEEPHFGES